MGKMIYKIKCKNTEKFSTVALILWVNFFIIIERGQCYAGKAN